MSERAPAAPMLIAHRGASGYRPEHTESCYRLAIEQGADAVEPDIVVSSDGVLVIRHENEISGTTDVADRAEFASRRTTKLVDGHSLTGWFTEDFTWAELQTLRCVERVPELRPLNTRFDGEEPMLSLRRLLRLLDEMSAVREKSIIAVLEIKHAHALQALGHDLVTLLLDELKAAGWANRAEQLVIECFELSPLERLRDAGLEAQFVFLLESTGSPADEIACRGAEAASYEWYRNDAGLDSLVGRVHGISVAKRDLLRLNARGVAVGASDVVQRAHARGLSVYTWTLRPENRHLTAGFRRGSQPGAWGEWRGEWQLLLSTGVDGVFLDHPDLLAKL